MPPLETELIGKQIGSYQLIRYIARGASALVFEATRGTETFALKVFDPEFLARNGDAVQIKRIERQLLLKGKHHPNLIEIIDGGQCSLSNYYYIVMPLIDALTIDKVLGKIPRASIRPILSQLSEAAKFLETLGIYHRDIKPANIAIYGTHLEKVILLDLGVIRPLGLAEVTDTTDTKAFVGTTRYSPPEFLLRDEDEGSDGYKAVTFYQIGAVLHDLLMRRQLFHDRVTPYGKLVRAVLIEEPVIDCNDAPLDLIRLARSCLLKDPTKRLKLVSWDSFAEQDASSHSVTDIRAKIQKLRAAKATSTSSASEKLALAELASKAAKVLLEKLKQSCLDDPETFPPASYVLEKSVEDTFALSISFSPSARHGFDKHLHCSFHVKATNQSPRVIEMSFSAGLSSTAAIPPDALAKTRIGHDVCDGDGFELCLTNLYESVSLALEVTVSDSVPDASNASTITWLTNVGEK